MSISSFLAALQREGFPMGAEPSVAIDLVDTLANAHTSPHDLLAGGSDAWWGLQSVRLPEGQAPTPKATALLRDALREILEATIDDRLPDGKAVDELNRVAGSVQTSPRLVVGGGPPRRSTQWHITPAGNLRLAAIAHDAIELLADPVRRSQLRRCANPACSMIFLAENPRRVWCAANICGNRARVARHHQRQKNHPGK